jgi:hypothetical protein
VKDFTEIRNEKFKFNASADLRYFAETEGLVLIIRPQSLAAFEAGARLEPNSQEGEEQVNIHFSSFLKTLKKRESGKTGFTCTVHTF